MELSRGIFWGEGVLIFHQKSGECHDIQRKKKKKKILKINPLIDIILLQLSRAEPGNPAITFIIKFCFGDICANYGRLNDV